MRYAMGSNFKEYLEEQVKKYHGVLVPVKASLPERLLVRKVRCSRLHPNPNDEFSDPAIGPNYGIISEYERKIKECDRNGSYLPPWEDPILVEKMAPDGYLILNGHHRWAACVRIGVPRIGIHILNLTQETDIRKILQRSNHDKRATFDLEEVVFCAEEENAQKPPRFPFNRFYRERIRAGIPTVFHYLKTHEYDIWVYTASYYSIDYIRRLFRSYHVHVDGIVTGVGKPGGGAGSKAKELEKMIKSKYQKTVHIDRSSVVFSHAGSKVFEQYTLGDDPDLWSREVMKILHEQAGDGDENHE